MQQTAVFVGSFDPFTIGHHAIVQRALPLFNRLVIGVGVNAEKKCMFSAHQRVEAIANLYANEPRIAVQPYTQLTIDFAKSVGAQFIVKGIRSVTDLEYERIQADINLQLGNIETLFLLSEPRYASISSTVVRELMHYGHDVREWLPTPLCETKNKQL